MTASDSVGNSMMRIPVVDLHRQTERLRPALLAAINRVLDRSWYVLGPEVRAFEEEFADYCGRRYCVGVGNGFNALSITLRALDIGPGDEVITVANAGGFSTLAIVNSGAKPHFVDIEPSTYNIDPTAAKAALNARTRAILVTHLYGRLADVATLARLAHDNGLPIIEDCAQAHGAQRPKQIGSSQRGVDCYSFYPVKNLGALGDGGAILTDDTALCENVRHLRQYGWGEKDKTVAAGGCNSRLDELQAAVLRTKLSHVDVWNERRREIFTRYSDGVSRSEISWPPRASGDHALHLCVASVTDRDSFRDRLAERGVGTAIHYPMADYDQPAYRGSIYPPQSLPNTEHALRHIVTVPNFAEMEDREVDYVIDAMNQSLCEPSF